MLTLSFFFLAHLCQSTENGRLDFSKASLMRRVPTPIKINDAPLSRLSYYREQDGPGIGPFIVSLYVGNFFKNVKHILCHVAICDEVH